MKVTTEQLALILADIKSAVEAGDSFEGNLTYSCMDEDLKPGEFNVTAMYRIGNSQGQGGCVMINEK